MTPERLAEIERTAFDSLDYVSRASIRDTLAEIARLRIFEKLFQDFASMAEAICDTHDTPGLSQTDSYIEVWKRQRDEIARLQAELSHWKANHDAQVARNTILRDRTDLTPEQWAERNGYKDDAERYRYIRIRRTCTALRELFGVTPTTDFEQQEKQLDAAIDAARRET